MCMIYILYLNFFPFGLSNTKWIQLVFTKWIQLAFSTIHHASNHLITIVPETQELRSPLGGLEHPVKMLAR